MAADENQAFDRKKNQQRSFPRKALSLLRCAFAALIQPEITGQDNKIKAEGKQYLQRLGVRQDRSSFCGALFVRTAGDKGCGCVDRKASLLLASITCAHTLAQSFAWIVRGLLAEWYGGRLVPECGETLE